MPKTTKIIDAKLVKDATEALNNLGDSGTAAIRLRAIISAYKHGIKKVSEVYDINRSSLHRWVALFREGSLEGLQNVKKPPRARLSKDRQLIVKTWIDKDSNITIKKIGIMIEESFGLSLSKSSIHRMIAKLGFSHITGRKRHYKSDESAQTEFKKKSSRKSSTKPRN